MININARIMQKRPTGVQRYLSNLLEHFNSQHSDELQTLKPSARYANGLKAHLWEQTALWQQTKRGVLFSPSNSGPMFHPNHIVTVHDLVALDYPEHLDPKFARFYQHLLPVLAKRARHLLTVSEFTASRIQERLQVPADRITVTPLAAATPNKASTEDMATITAQGIEKGNYFLVLGSVEPRKNINAILQVWPEYQQKNPEHKLVIVGLDGNTELSAVFGQAKQPRPQPKGVHYLGYRPDTHVAWLLENSIALLYPSVYEGFGLPVMEAMQIGTPAITSKNTPMADFGRDAVMLIDPYAPQTILEAMQTLAESPQQRSTMIHKGKAIAAEYSWAKTAQQTWQVLARHA